jgi:hypothetical protein
MTIALGELPPSMTDPEGSQPREKLIYRSGGTNPGNFKIRPAEQGVSFRDSISNPIDSKSNPPLKSGAYVVVDAGKLPSGCVIYDNAPPGHVTVTASPEEIRAAIVKRGRLP